MLKSISEKLNTIPGSFQFFPNNENHIPQFVKDNKLTLLVGGIASACVFSQCKSLSSYLCVLMVPATLTAMAVGPWLRQLKQSDGYTEELYKKDLKETMTATTKIWGSVFCGIAGKYLLVGSLSLIQGIYNKNAYDALKGFKHIILASGILIPYAHEFFLKVDKGLKDPEDLVHTLAFRMKGIYDGFREFKANPRAFMQKDMRLLSSKNSSGSGQALGTASSKNWVQKITQHLTFDNIFSTALAGIQIQHQPVATISGIAIGTLFHLTANKFRIAAHGVYVLNKSKQLTDRIFSLNKEDRSITGHSKRMYLSLLATTLIMKNGPFAPVVAGLFYSRTLCHFLPNRSLV